MATEVKELPKNLLFSTQIGTTMGGGKIQGFLALGLSPEKNPNKPLEIFTTSKDLHKADSFIATLRAQSPNALSQNLLQIMTTWRPEIDVVVVDDLREFHAFCKEQSGKQALSLEERAAYAWVGSHLGQAAEMRVKEQGLKGKVDQNGVTLFMRDNQQRIIDGNKILTELEVKAKESAQIHVPANRFNVAGSDAEGRYIAIVSGKGSDLISVEKANFSEKTQLTPAQYSSYLMSRLGDKDDVKIIAHHLRDLVGKNYQWKEGNANYVSKTEINGLTDRLTADLHSATDPYQKAAYAFLLGNLGDAVTQTTYGVSTNAMKEFSELHGKTLRQQAEAELKKLGATTKAPAAEVKKVIYTPEEPDPVPEVKDPGTVVKPKPPAAPKTGGKDRVPTRVVAGGDAHPIQDMKIAELQAVLTCLNVATDVRWTDGIYKQRTNAAVGQYFAQYGDAHNVPYTIKDGYKPNNNDGSFAGVDQGWLSRAHLFLVGQAKDNPEARAQIVKNTLGLLTKEGHINDNDVDDVKAGQIILSLLNYTGTDGEKLKITGKMDDNTRYALSMMRQHETKPEATAAAAAPAAAAPAAVTEVKPDASSEELEKLRKERDEALQRAGTAEDKAGIMGDQLRQADEEIQGLKNKFNDCAPAVPQHDDWGDTLKSDKFLKEKPDALFEKNCDQWCFKNNKEAKRENAKALAQELLQLDPDAQHRGIVHIGKSVNGREGRIMYIRRNDDGNIAIYDFTGERDKLKGLDTVRFSDSNLRDFRSVAGTAFGANASIDKSVGLLKKMDGDELGFNEHYSVRITGEGTPRLVTKDYQKANDALLAKAYNQTPKALSQESRWINNMDHVTWLIKEKGFNHEKDIRQLEKGALDNALEQTTATPDTQDPKKKEEPVVDDLNVKKSDGQGTYQLAGLTTQKPFG